MSYIAATILCLVLALMTVVLQLMMYVERGKFLRTLKRQKGIFDLELSSIDRFSTTIQIVFPTRLEVVTEEKLKRLRESAVKASRYWMISLLTTITIPIMLFKLLE